MSKRIFSGLKNVLFLFFRFEKKVDNRNVNFQSYLASKLYEFIKALKFVFFVFSVNIGNRIMKCNLD